MSKGIYDTLVLAAGTSTRMGEWKLILPLRGKTIIERSVFNALRVSKRVILVGGYRVKELEKLFRDCDRVKVVFNRGYKRGMFSSIRCGVQYVETERFFITLGDMPLISSSTFIKIARYDFADYIDVIRPQYMGRKGHPVLLSHKLCDRILAMDDNSTMSDILKDYLNLYVPVNDPFVVRDIDSREDYRSLVEELENFSDRVDV